jgi:hypothetical protein
MQAGNIMAARVVAENALEAARIEADEWAEWAQRENAAAELHRGNVDAIYPNTPDAKRRKTSGEFTDSPFLSTVGIVATMLRDPGVNAKHIGGLMDWCGALQSVANRDNNG